MNQPESLVPSVTAPLQQHKVQLISKGYSCQEVKEANSVISIFRFCHTDLQDELISIPPLSNN